MRAIGLAVDMPKPGRPVVRCVVLDDPHGPTHTANLADVVQFEAFDLATAHTDWASIASQFFQDVSGRVSSLGPDVVVVRRADVYKLGRLGDGPRLRLVVEGAITAAAKSHVANTHLRTGVECATKYMQDKTVLDADGNALTANKHHAEAAAAGLSGLFANRA
jgi:hypothetical protein